MCCCLARLVRLVARPLHPMHEGDGARLARAWADERAESLAESRADCMLRSNA